MPRPGQVRYVNGKRQVWKVLPDGSGFGWVTVSGGGSGKGSGGSTGGSGGSGGSVGSGGGSGGGTGGGRTGESERELQEKKYKKMYEDLFPDSNKGKFKMPKELLDLAIENEWTADRLAGWVRNNQKDAWVATKVALDRAAEMQKYLDSIFGRFDKGSAEAKQIAKLIKQYVFAQPDKWGAYKFISQFVATTKNTLFSSNFPGWEEFSRTIEAQTDIMSAINNYKQRRDDYEKQYRRTLSDLNAKIPDELLRLAFENGWTIQEVDAWVRQNDEAYVGSGTAQERGMDFDDFWKTIFGDEVEVDRELKEKYQRSKDTMTLTDFFNDYIENSEAFQEMHPSYESWKQHFIGAPGAEVHVDPFLYFRRKNELILAYDTWVKGESEVNKELIEKALANNWDEERMLIEFKKTDPAYTRSDEYKQRSAVFTQYWRELFGMNSNPDQTLLAEYVSSNLEYPSDMFDKIRGTSEFRSQYGSWDVFAAAQDAKGNTAAILRNPAMYKQYRDAIRKAFESVGLAAPDDYTLFKSGVEESEVSAYIDTYLRSAPSYRWLSNENVDVYEATSMRGDKKQAGDLRVRMAKALEKHKAYAGSSFITPSVDKEEETGFITQKI